MDMRKRAYLYAVTHLEEIGKDRIKKAGFTLGRSACHENSVAAFHGDRADSVWMVLAGNSNGCVLHFINAKGGMFFDETWHEEDHQRYWIIRQVKEKEFENIGALLDEAKMSIVLQVGTIARKLLAGRGRFGF